MKYGPVVPDIEEPFPQWRGRDISLDPLHEAGILPEPPTGHGQRLTGEIQNGQVAVAVIDKVIKGAEDCGVELFVQMRPVFSSHPMLFYP